jgi:hypothetical protein
LASSGGCALGSAEAGSEVVAVAVAGDADADSVEGATESEADWTESLCWVFDAVASSSFMEEEHAVMAKIMRANINANTLLLYCILIGLLSYLS